MIYSDSLVSHCLCCKTMLSGSSTHSILACGGCGMRSGGTLYGPLSGILSGQHSSTSLLADARDAGETQLQVEGIGCGGHRHTQSFILNKAHYMQHTSEKTTQQTTIATHVLMAVQSRRTRVLKGVPSQPPPSCAQGRGAAVPCGPDNNPGALQLPRQGC